MSAKIRIMIVEDYDEFLFSMEIFLNQFHDFEVVATTTNGDGIIETVLAKHVDILLQDINLKNNNLEGIEIAREVSLLTETRVIMLTSLDQHDIVFHASQSGAVAYVMKENFNDLPRIIRESYEKTSSWSRLNKLEREHVLNQFTHTELETFKDLARGYSQKEIAERKNISYQTVKLHVHHVIKKMNVKSSKQVLSILHKFKIF